MRGEVGRYGWVDTWEVHELFPDSGISARIPRVGPYQPAEERPFRQRPGDPLLLFKVRRRVDGRILEFAQTYPMGDLTPTVLVRASMEEVKAALAAQNLVPP
jgi:hypothetical protein